MTGYGATRLTDDEIGVLREAAQARTTPFVDPIRLRKVQTWWRHDLLDWAGAILGHAVSQLRDLPWAEWVLLDLAHDAEPTPPTTAGHRNAATTLGTGSYWDRVARDQQQWRLLRDALPVPVGVAHNYTSRRHVEFYVQGADHIILLADLSSGRLHRKTRYPLCWTPSRAKDLVHFPELETDGVRVPTCKACLRTARQVAARTTPPGGSSDG